MECVMKAAEERWKNQNSWKLGERNKSLGDRQVKMDNCCLVNYFDIW